MVPNELKDKIHQQLLTNQRETDGNRYTLPSETAYPYQWLWDSCFHALMWRHFDIEMAKDELHALTVRQWENGMIPHMHYWEEHPTVMKVDWGHEGTSALTQPPLLAIAAMRVYETDGDTDFLQAIYPAIARFHEYLLTRRLPERGLIGIINPDESGEDNSPRYDDALNLPPQHPVEDHSKKRFALFKEHIACNHDAPNCTSKAFWSEDVPFNSFFVWNTEVLATIAGVCGDNEAAARWRAGADEVGQAMRAHLFRDGAFCSSYDTNGSLATTNSWSQFAPLVAGLYSQSEAEQIVRERLLDENQFWSHYPIPTVALDDPAYAPKEPDYGDPWQHPHWRGPVWLAPNWTVYHGLKRYGLDAEAAQLRDRSIALVEHGGLREYYHPTTGVGMGAHGFTWGGLILDMA
jgi:glycogen debranching enzyme